MRELGLEKFGGGQVFCTEAAEVCEEREWRDRDGTGAGAGAAEKPLTEEERELQGVKRAEDEERHGTKGRDTGMGGGGNVGVVMPVEEEAKGALKALAQETGKGRGMVVQLVGVLKLGLGSLYWRPCVADLLCLPVYRHSDREAHACLQ